MFSLNTALNPRILIGESNTRMSYIYCLLYPVAHGAIHSVFCQIYRVLITKVNETSASFPKRTLFAVHFAHFSAANCYRNHKGEMKNLTTGFSESIPLLASQPRGGGMGKGNFRNASGGAPADRECISIPSNDFYCDGG